MNEGTKARPTVVTVIGWAFIILAVLMILSGSMGLLVYKTMEQMRTEMPPPTLSETMPKTFRLMEGLFQYYDLLAMLQIVFAVFVLIAGIQFLQLRAWARTALEIVAWIGLTYTMAFTVFFVFSWIDMSSEASGLGVSTAFDIMGALMGVIVVIVFATPLAVAIKFLRGAIVREAVREN